MAWEFVSASDPEQFQESAWSSVITLKRIDDETLEEAVYSSATWFNSLPSQEDLTARGEKLAMDRAFMESLLQPSI